MWGGVCGNDFQIDIIMSGVCISQWRFGNANEFRGLHKTAVGDISRQRTAVGYKRQRLATKGDT